MSFLFRAFAGKADVDSPGSKGADTIDRLLHRLESVTLVADRRDGLRQLKDVAKDHRVHIAAHGMDILLQILEQDRSDQEIVAIILDILCVIMSDSDGIPGRDTTSSQDGNSAQKLGGQLTEIFLKKSEHLMLLLEFVREYQFQIRWPAVRLLCIMANSSPKTFQDVLLTVGGAVSNLMDLLTDNREIIRNDGVLLLLFITKNDASLQKIIAFSKAFDILLDIIRDEGFSEGGVVVEDCLLVISNLLENNTSNIKLFKEDGCIQKLCNWFSADKLGSSSWSEQRKTNATRMLNVVRNLVSPLLPSPIVRSCQDTCSKCGLVSLVCAILMTPGVPLNVLVQALNTVAELIRGNPKIQEDFSAMEAPLKPPRPALAILLLSMLNERQAFDLRLAVLYVLKSFLYKNSTMQMTVLQSVTYDPNSSSQHTLGQLLSGALFSPDNLNQWCSQVAFLHCIVDSLEQKKMLLSLNVQPSVAMPSSSVMQQSVHILRESTSIQSKIVALQLLCVWLSDCSEAVEAFLQIESIMLLLLMQIVDTPLESSQKLFQGLCAFLFGVCIRYDRKLERRTEMVELVRNRVGVETFREKIVQVARLENFLIACQRPDPVAKSFSDLSLDYDFIKFYRATEGRICRAIDESQEEQLASDPEAFNQQRSELLIKDSTIADLEAQLKQALFNYSQSSQQKENLSRRVELLTSEIHIRDQEIDTLQRGRMEQHSNARQEETTKLEQQMQHLAATTTQMQQTIEQYEGLMPELEHLRFLTVQQQNQITSYYQYFEQQKDGGDLSSGLILEKTELTARTEHLDSLLFSWQAEANRLKEDLSGLKNEFTQKEVTTDELLSITRSEADQKRQELEEELEKLRVKYSDLNMEQADLLELVTDSDQKIRNYRERLRRLGEPVSDDDMES